MCQSFPAMKNSLLVQALLISTLLASCGWVIRLKSQEAPSTDSLEQSDFEGKKDQYGRVFSMKEALTKGPVAVYFYRGHWWAWCKRLLGELAHEKAALTCYYDLLKLAEEGKNILIEEYAREMITSEELHLDEVNKMLRNPGDIGPFKSV